MTGTVVVIGPVAVGKTTVGRALAERLGRRFVDVDDDVAEAVYDELGMGYDVLFARADRDGAVAAYRWWEPALVAAAERALRDHTGAVIAFGAGHAHFTQRPHADRVATLLEEATVVLLRAHADDDRAIELVRARSISERDHDWCYGDVDYIADWVRSDQNRRLADLEVVTDGNSLETIVEVIVSRLP